MLSARWGTCTLYSGVRGRPPTIALWVFRYVYKNAETRSKYFARPSRLRGYPPSAHAAAASRDLRRLICAVAFLMRIVLAAFGSRGDTEPQLAPSPRTFHSHLPHIFPSHLCFAPSPRTFPSHLSFAPFPRTGHSHPPIAPSTRALPSVGVPFACTLHSLIARSWSAPATRSACTSLRSTCRWCPRSRGYPSSAPSKQLRLAWKRWPHILLPAMRPQ